MTTIDKHAQAIRAEIESIQHTHGKAFERDAFARIKSHLSAIYSHPLLQAIQLIERWKETGN